ncbi:hypothetical protein TSUD_329120, partial [Trifolium subterraneum]
SRASSHEASKILNILATYEQASGQVVNLDKSEASFSRNVRNEDKDMICNMMGAKAVEAQSRYLGFPIPFGKSKKAVFSFVMDRVWKKVKGWKERFLSRAGKETLIKAVAQAIPNYILSYYKMPVGCCKDIDSLLAKFWWGSNEEKRKIHWMSWERLSKAKLDGGMGFRGMEDFNKALLGKHCWRLVTGESSLLEKIMKSRYYPRGIFLCAKEGYQPSYAWRSILSARDIVTKGGVWKIGNGRKVAQNIISLPISFRLPQDTLIWNWEKDGVYSVRSAYHLLCDEKARLQPGPSCPKRSKLWKEIWRAPVPNKVKNFIWRLAKNILPTRTNLHNKGIKLDLQCPLCFREEESSQHLFLKCDIFKLTLFASHLGRNASVFNGIKLDPGRLALDVTSFVHDFNEANPPSMSGPTVWGLVLRNSDGETIFSACKREEISVDPLMAEALGVRWALQLVVDQGINSVSIHSDAANVVNCINRKSSFAAINLIAEDCRNLMTCLANVCDLFVSRTQNSDAHNLASLARIMGNRTWQGVAPHPSGFSVSADFSTDLLPQRQIIPLKKSLCFTLLLRPFHPSSPSTHYVYLSPPLLSSPRPTPSSPPPLVPPPLPPKHPPPQPPPPSPPHVAWRIQSYIKSTLDLDSDETLWKSESSHSERVQKLQRGQKLNKVQKLKKDQDICKKDEDVQKLNYEGLSEAIYSRPIRLQVIKGSSEAKEIPLVIRRATSTTLIKPDDLIKDN